MGKISLLTRPLVLFLIASLSIPLRAQTHTPKASASLEVGGGSYERRFFRPRLRFSFPIKTVTFLLDLDYYQRINSRLQGEIDFWLGIGYQRPVSEAIILEAGINHFCRHVTSRYNPEILDINEAVAKIWINYPGFTLGLGGGGFLGFSHNYNHLWILNLRLPHILNTEFSFDSEIKLIDTRKFLYEFELSCALDQSLDFFIRYTKHYVYSPTTYFGIRFKSADKAKDYVGKFRFGSGVYPFYADHKVIAENEFKLEFLESPERRVLVTMNGIIPILRKRNFLGPFWPEKIRYPLSLEYLRKITSGLFAIGYCRYDISMPMDVDQEFQSSLGIGLALRNQVYFAKFDNPVRFEFYTGHSFSHSYDAGFRLGLNTVDRPLNLGGNIYCEINPDEWQGRLKIQAEFGKEIKIRPYLGYQYLDSLKDRRESIGKLLFGIELIKFY